MIAEMLLLLEMAVLKGVQCCEELFFPAAAAVVDYAAAAAALGCPRGTAAFANRIPPVACTFSCSCSCCHSFLTSPSSPCSPLPTIHLHHHGHYLKGRQRTPSKFFCLSAFFSSWSRRLGCYCRRRFVCMGQPALPVRPLSVCPASCAECPCTDPRYPV